MEKQNRNITSARSIWTGEVLQDLEGQQIMRVLGKNMAWLMKLVEYGKGNVAEPEKEDKTAMNFIR